MLRIKKQRLLKHSLVSLEYMTSIMKDHYLASPLWPNTPSNPILREIVLYEFRKLSRHERRILKLRWFEEKTWINIEQKTGLSRQWCKKLEHKALEKLKESKRLKEYIEKLYSGSIDIDEFQVFKGD